LNVILKIDIVDRPKGDSNVICALIERLKCRVAMAMAAALACTVVA